MHTHTPVPAAPVRLEQTASRISFVLLCLGQSVSLFGSSLTGFALGLLAYRQSGSVAAYGLIALAAALPRILLSPLAGSVADRYSRPRVMIFADTGAGLATLAAALLWLTASLQPWHVILLTAVSSAFGAFQFPAYTAAVTSLVEPAQLTRANGLAQLGSALVEILAPAAAGALVIAVGLPGILAVDFTTFLFAVVTTAFVARRHDFRPPAKQPEVKITVVSPARFFNDFRSGWRLLHSTPGLTSLIGFITIYSFFWGMVPVLAAPLMLGISDPGGMGLLMTAAGLGMLTGSLVMSAAASRPRLARVILFELATAICFVLMGLKPWMILVGAAAFGAHFLIAFIQGTTRALLQRQADPAIQGRVFAAWQMATESVRLLAFLTTGLLADRVFEPLMADQGLLAGTVGQVLGTGPGRGVALMFVLMGTAKLLVSLVYSVRLRSIEKGGAMVEETA